MELFVSSCVYSRLMLLLAHPNNEPRNLFRDVQAGVLYMQSAYRRNARRLAELNDNDDAEQTRTADAFLDSGLNH